MPGCPAGDDAPADRSWERSKAAPKDDPDEDETRPEIEPDPIAFALYDLEADPQERRDLAEREPEVYRPLKARLLDWSRDFEHLRRRR